MIICRVKNLSGREVLAENLYLPNGQILMKQGTPLKTEYIEALLELGVETLRIKNPYKLAMKPNYFVDISTLEYFKCELRKILEQHIYKQNEPLKKVEGLADELVSDLMQRNLSNAVDIYNRESNLYEHLIYTTILAVAVGIRMKFNKKKLKDLAFGCMIHDLGLRYINVPYSGIRIEEMTPKEIFELKNHTILGYTSLESESWIPQIVKKLVLSHHEKIDGTGYPLKQKNKETECFILQVCDTFDGMISGIERKRELLIPTLEELYCNKKLKYKESITDTLLSMIGAYPTGSVIETENRIGVVIQQTDDPIRPKVMFMDDGMNIHNLKANPEFKIKLL